ncbi:MAG TPA: ribonuclease H-like domain-containing protein [Candidatus Anaerobutyricum stercoripullorum]|uniref:Ribonuclease H-like domain-containing protein n=1 Tax=Candidatus Anaerobutyricum stercoripullorum TaxID=2838456 RepID=A0A9D1X6Y0_9FIRM|nr:ribonuclease H-like domain-containing protein [Candidatus Anaerobutyricum stercoripullorum]
MLIRHYDFPSALPEPDTQEDSYTFLDIETTGLKRDTTILYLIGCGFHTDGGFHIIQWFNDDGVSEPEMLAALRDFLASRPSPLFTFNGESFDIPYLNRHYELNEMAYRLPEKDSLDLYRALRPFQALFHLSRGTQKDWEAFLGIDREDPYRGGQLISFYKKYLRTKDTDLLDLLLLHNMEDIRGMEALLPLTACVDLLQHTFLLENVSLSGELLPDAENPGADADCAALTEKEAADIRHSQYLTADIRHPQYLTAVCRLRRPLPKPLQVTTAFSDMLPQKTADTAAVERTKTPALQPAPRRIDRADDFFSLSIAGDRITMRVPVLQGSLKYFYPDYRNYYYLPEEDRAIHKSVGCYVDSRFREKAKPDTCYVRKEGLFLPVFPEKKYKGIRTGPKTYVDALPLYKHSCREKLSFVELQPLATGDPEVFNRYLCDLMKEILIADIHKNAG